MSTKTVLLTGGARRIGAAIARALHRTGMNLALHYRSSSVEAATLRDELNGQRPDSVLLLQAELRNTAGLPALVEQTIDKWGRLDVLINNASSFFPTPLGRTTEADWDELLAGNLKAPFFLSQAAAPYLQAVQGCIVNLVDIYAERPLANHPVYCAAKAGLRMLTRSLALELGPDVRVNGIAPGAILWPEQGMSDTAKTQLLSRVPLRRQGEPEDIARTVLFLVQDAPYISGQIIAVDGGRSLSL
ncbi:MAG: pteridine reductase [Candidatus Competibacteraceae bacterium]